MRDILSVFWKAEARGGRLPYTYSWSGLFTGSGTQVFGGVATPGGTLTVDVDDASARSEQSSVVISSKTYHPQVCPE